MRRLLLLPAALLVLAALLPACSPSHQDASAPALVASSMRGRPLPPGGGSPADQPSGYFPLDEGDWWLFDYAFEVRGVADDGTPTTYPPYRTQLEHRVVCSEERDGRTYDVVRLSYADPGVMHFWIRYREDRDGLYEYDETGGPPACDSLPYDPKRIGAPSASALPGDAVWPAVAARLGASGHEAAWRSAWERLRAKRAILAALPAGLPASPAALGPVEIQRLAYPLRPGQSWQIRPEINFRSLVEGAVVLRTPAGSLPTWSIRITNDAMGPEDVVRVWYGSTGYLGLDAHFVDVATDQSGNPVGTLYANQSETLVDLHLIRDRNREGHDRFPRPGLALGH